ncbi:MAG: ribosome biogenesis GTPase Der [Candidatus Omnitrophica bacterium]|nr:ribosome biogenesis GTPase Der [Candidatus Omnitrophota bacterium]
MSPKENFLPTIVIVGSQNVGKSSLFNRLIRKRKSIVESTPGVTRNRVNAELIIGNKKIMLIDTGGLKSGTKEVIEQFVYQQVRLTLDEADIIFFVCDAKRGITSSDYNVVSLLRKSSKKVFLVVNKTDNKQIESETYDFYKLGIGKPYPISALSGYGIEGLLKDVVKILPEIPKSKQPPKQKITVAIVGRQNVGKSSFINAVLNQQAVIVDKTPGTTTDAVDIYFEYKDNIFILVDTAGMKHKKKLRKTIDVFSIARSKETIRNAQIVLIMLDAQQGLCVDDIKIIEYVAKNFKPFAVLVNKWDLITHVQQYDYMEALKERLKMLGWVCVIFISCLTKRNITQALDMVPELHERSHKTIKTSQLNKVLEEIQRVKAHPLVHRKKVHVYYGLQTRVSPQEFMLFCNYPELLRQDYLHYIENSIRQHFDLSGVPIRLKLKEST